MNADNTEFLSAFICVYQRPIFFSPLPDPAGVLADHRLARLARKRLLKLRRVLQRAVHAVAARRVRVRNSASADLLGRRILAPDLGESRSEEHTSELQSLR